MKNTMLNSAQQKRRLRWILLLFFMIASLPVYYLLQTVYGQLEKEAYFTARHQAEQLVDQLELNIQHLLETEQNRPIAEYSFFNVLENPLLSESTGVKFSPLSTVPPKTAIKGLIGYFQINTDGSFHLPVLPEIGQDNISGLSLAELDTRLKIKHRLQDLLSIKIAETTTKRDRKKSAEHDRVVSVVAKRSYIDAFKQKSKMMLDDDVASPQILAEMESTEARDDKPVLSEQSKRNYAVAKKGFKTQSIKKEKKYKTRKEIVQLPDQKMASSFFNRSIQQNEVLVAEQNVVEGAMKDRVIGKKNVSPSAINVLSFETEVSPLQLLLIGKNHFCLYRYVWHDNNRFTQGFIVKKDVFLNAVSKNLFTAINMSSLLFSEQSATIQKISLNQAEQEYPLYSRQLSSPFQKIEIAVNAGKLTTLAGGFIIDLLALAIYCIFFIGFLVFYRLGCWQIYLAQQQQDFISAVSHELKTPLTSIRMYGEMLRSGWVIDDDKRQSYYDFIFFESERLSRLINNVLQLARLGHQQRSAELVEMSVQTLFNKIKPRLDAQIEGSTFSLNMFPLDHAIQNIEIKMDEDAFFQMVINIVDNAIKFSHQAECQQIDIGSKVSKNKRAVIFFIRDYGPGIKKQQLKKIFQLFYRSGDELTRTTPGTGIGLALVAQLAETMAAKITVENKQPGAEFQISFPVSS